MAKKVNFVDVTLRDGQQSLAATRMTTRQALSVLKMIDDAGFTAMELWGGATLDSCMRFLDEDPWERLEKFRKILGSSTKIRALLRGQNLFAYQPYPDDLVIAFVKQAVRSGVGLMRIFDALNDWRNLQVAILATKAYGGKVEAAISYTVSPVHTRDYFVEYACKLAEEGADQIAIKDMAGLLYPTEAVKLFRALKSRLLVPLTFHGHTTTGVSTLNAVIAMQEGIHTIDSAITPFAGGTSHPPIEVLIVFAEEMGIDHGLNKKLLLKIQKRLFDVFEQLGEYIHHKGKYYRPVSYEDVDREKVQKILKYLQKGGKKSLEKALVLMRELLKELRYPKYDDRIFESQIPGGMLSNLRNQLKQMGNLEQLDQILEEVPAVRRDVGYVPLVTPTSQIVGSQASFNVLFGQRYQMVSNEFKMLLKGEFGRPPIPPDPDLVKRILGPGEKQLQYRPAFYLHPVMEEKYDLPFVRSRKDLLLHLMLKRSADDFLRRRYNVE